MTPAKKNPSQARPVQKAVRPIQQAVPSIQKVLIANRGEVAVRVMTTLQQMNIATVAVYTAPDRDAPHVALADQACLLPGDTLSETYLNIEAIIAHAQAAGADAIHPGYGFLSENAAFATACAAAGITFIGPSPQVIQHMGDKVQAKQLMADAGVPVIPGWLAPTDATASDFQREAKRIGYPILVKAAGGGGGRGMRRVETAAELAGALDAARREADQAFGNAHVFLEKYLSAPRHIEFQIFGDTHGTVIHLFERECSIQRRHQKVIEESPSVALDAPLRDAMAAVAIKAARTLGYTNAGTVEMMLDADNQFYFLEINTRLQVEHPITEACTGLDLVRMQIEVAEGRPLPAQQAIQPVAMRLSAASTPKIRPMGFCPRPARSTRCGGLRGRVSVWIAAFGKRARSRRIMMRCSPNSWCGHPTARPRWLACAGHSLRP